MIRRHHQDVLLPHGGKKLRKAPVKIRQGLCVAVHIVAVAVEHVVVHQVGKAQAMEIPFHIFQRPVDPLRVGGGAHKIRDAAACENIIDLSHGQNLLPRFLQHIQHGIPGGH